jgi:nucleoside-diphosphate-sugar epimerase
MKKVLVTGSTGQVGSRLLKYLPSTEFEIYTITSNSSKINKQLPFKAITLDLLVDEIDVVMGEISPELLIHLAWETKPNTFWDSPDNERWLEASKSLVKSFEKHGGAKMVVSGTCAEYDWRESKVLAETDVEFPQSIYGHTKLQLLNFLRERPLPFLWTRTFFQFGDDEPVGRFVPSAIDAISLGKIFTVRKPDDIRDFIYVNDVARIIASLVVKGEEGIYNIGSGKGVSMRELGGEIASALGSMELLQFQHQIEKPSIVIANTVKLKQALGDFPSTSLASALEKTIAVRGTDERI